MNDIAIKVENLSKLYRIGAKQESYKTLRATLTEGVTAPFRRLASVFGHSYSVVRPRSSVVCNDTIWALKDVSFEIKQGEVVGIIGMNGAGKTTLLKVLSRITEPTEGQGQLHGRVASLLEVGTGFNSELTGRENIYLNGAILGMKKTEIDRKFDEIVHFSGVEQFIDTPVKHFSSGMHVRLAFAVAAHLEPEILLVDEVLAVGDVAFQQKCLGKMQGVAKEGRTILLVSHNMAAIRNLCQRTLLIDSGRIIVDGPTDQAINKYLDRNLQEGAVTAQEQLEDKVTGVIKRDHPTIRFREVALIDEKGLPRNEFQSDEEIRVSVTYECLTVVNDLRVAVIIVDEENTPILMSLNIDDTNILESYRREPGAYRLVCVLPADMFGERRFYVTVHLEYPKVEHLVLNKILSFDVKFRGYGGLHSSGKGPWIRPRLRWLTQSLPGEQVAIDG